VSKPSRILPGEGSSRNRNERLWPCGIIAHELHEAVRDFFTDATIDQLLLGTAEFGEFGKNSLPTERDDEVSGVSDGGVRGEA